MDVYCVCGDQFHIDAEFAYAVQCPHCKRRYEMGTRVEMREMAPDEKWDGCPILTELTHWTNGSSSSARLRLKNDPIVIAQLQIIQCLG